MNSFEHLVCKDCGIAWLESYDGDLNTIACPSCREKGLVVLSVRFRKGDLKL